MNKLSNNSVHMTGEIVSEFAFSHECAGERFYTSKLKVARNSGYSDTIPIMTSDRLIAAESKGFAGLKSSVIGQFRSHNEYVGGKKVLELYVFVLDIAIVDFSNEDDNKISLNGYICKPPIYRKTPLGREIADLLIAANRSYGKPDYIPCIVWGRNARYISQFSVGTEVKLKGRIQSREYLKKLEDGTQETRIAYEVSVSRIDVVESKENEDESRSEENL